MPRFHIHSINVFQSFAGQQCSLTVGIGADGLFHRLKFVAVFIINNSGILNHRIGPFY